MLSMDFQLINESEIQSEYNELNRHHTGTGFGINSIKFVLPLL